MKLEPITDIVYSSVALTIAEVIATGLPEKPVWIIHHPEKCGFVACIEQADGRWDAPDVAGLIVTQTEDGPGLGDAWKITLGTKTLGEDVGQWPKAQQSP